MTSSLVCQGSLPGILRVLHIMSPEIGTQPSAQRMHMNCMSQALASSLGVVSSGSDGGGDGNRGTRIRRRETQKLMMAQSSACRSLGTIQSALYSIDEAVDAASWGEQFCSKRLFVMPLGASGRFKQSPEIPSHSESSI